MDKREPIIFSDVHGCLVELKELLDKIKYDPNKHRMISVLDLIDRGEHCLETLQFVRQMKFEAVLSNHESKMVAWRDYEEVRNKTGIPNPITVYGQRKKEWESYPKEDLDWIRGLPSILHIQDNWYVVHAGMEPSKPFDQQDSGTVTRIRYVDEKGDFVKKRAKYAESTFWAKKWNQPFNIIFGHTGFDEPTIFKNENNTCVGIDTGCVYGGKLTAYNLTRNEFVQVKAKKVYYKGRGK